MSGEIGDKAVTLRLLSEEEPAVEAWEASKHRDLLARAFGRRLKLKTAIVPEPTRCS